MKAKLPQVTVCNLQRKVRIDVVNLQKFARKAVKLCLRVPGKGTGELQNLPKISILIVSDRKIAFLHQKFMNEPGSTDVITFQHGEIFISGGMAKRNARRFGNSLVRELRLYIVHGLLHLQGLDDREPRNARKMETVQRRILAKAMV